MRRTTKQISTNADVEKITYELRRSLSSLSELFEEYTDLLWPASKPLDRDTINDLMDISKEIGGIGTFIKNEGRRLHSIAVSEHVRRDKLR